MLLKHAIIMFIIFTIFSMCLCIRFYAPTYNVNKQTIPHYLKKILVYTYHRRQLRDACNN